MPTCPDSGSRRRIATGTANKMKLRGHEMNHLRNWIASLIVIALVEGLSGCASSPVPPYAGHAPRLASIYVISQGWHTEIGLPARAMTGSLAALKRASPDSQFFVFGWGQRDYYMAQNPGLGDLLKASVPGPAVILIIPLTRPPPEFFAADASVFTIRVSQDGLDRLSQFIWRYIEEDSDHVPHRLGNGPYPGSSFYTSSGTYSLANTCNTWTAEALHVSGLPVSPVGVVFAHQVVDQVRSLARQER